MGIEIIYKLTWYLKTQILYRFFLRGISFNSYIGSFTFLYGSKNIKIGNRVRIFPNCRMECHDEAKININNDVSIGQNFHITSGGGLDLIIGSHTTISGNTFITNIDHEYREINRHILTQPHLCTKTEIGENCFIGYGCAIQAGTILGKQCIVGANSVVRGVFPDYCVIVGVPGRIIRRYNPNSTKWERTNPDGTFIENK